MTQVSTHKVKKSIKKQNGTVAIMAALVMLILIVVMGASYDLMKMTRASIRLQDALDSAMLTLLSSPNAYDVTEVEDFVRAHINDAFAYGGTWAGTAGVRNITQRGNTDTDGSARYRISVWQPTTFLKLIGIDRLRIHATSSVTYREVKVEISLVYDVSYSLRGQTFDAVKIASKDFIDNVYERISPRDASFSIIPFAGTVNLGQAVYDYYGPNQSNNGGVNPPPGQYVNANNGQSQGFFFTGQPSYCLEYDEADFDTNDLPRYSRTQVPFFLEPSSGTPLCPSNENSALFISNDADALKRKIDDMTLSFYSTPQDGMMWGLKALSPALRGRFSSDRPLPFDEEDSVKMLVLFVDGITNTPIPRNPYEPNAGVTSRPDGGLIFAGQGQDSALTRLEKVCQAARDNNVLLYVIQLQGHVSASFSDSLRTCASDPSRFFEVNDRNIERAFEDIESAISRIRLVPYQ